VPRGVGTSGFFRQQDSSGPLTRTRARDLRLARLAVTPALGAGGSSDVLRSPRASSSPPDQTVRRADGQITRIFGAVKTEVSSIIKPQAGPRHPATLGAQKRDRTHAHCTFLSALLRQCKSHMQRPCPTPRARALAVSSFAIFSPTGPFGPATLDPTRWLLRVGPAGRLPPRPPPLRLVKPRTGTSTGRARLQAGYCADASARVFCAGGSALCRSVPPARTGR
jgi:hypothetical protein